MNKLNLQTTNIVDENIKRIGELFPNCLTERLDESGKPEMAIDFDLLRQELSKSIVEGPTERYQFTWPDKRNAIRLANAPTTDTLRPCREESVNFDTTQNLYIEGDNLQVLKLLRENYLGKIKMIYIDPPYNTGNDFVYNDSFEESVGYYIQNSGQKDELGRRMVVNTDNNGRFHTDWLNMIFPRIKVSRDLLREDGVVFISIDDHEVDNLKKICNEVFGSLNFIGQIVIAKGTTTGQDANGIGSSVDYMLMYAKNKNVFQPNGLPLDEKDKSRFNLSDERGAYSILQFRKTGTNDRREDRPNLYFPLIAPDGSRVYPVGPGGYDSCWRADLKQFNKWEMDNMIVWKKNEEGFFKPYVKYYLEGRTKQVSNLWDDIEGNKKASITVRDLLGKNVFSFPKPVGLIFRCLKISVDKEDLVLDFFSGSATTAHAVMQLNAEDGGNRKFIMVQLPEETDPKSEAYKAGYKNICEIGKERIRRAGKKIVEEQKAKQADLFSGEQKPLDIGFRVLKLDSSNMEDVYYRPEESSEHTLFEDNIKPGRSSEDLLFQVMLECNLPLSAKIETEKIGGKEVFCVNEGYLIACFDEKVNENVIKEVAKRKPYYFVMRDSSLATDNVADNFEQIWQAYSKDTIRRIL